MQLRHHLQDDQYVLVTFRLGEDDYVFLYDANQRSLFLAQGTEAVDLLTFWQRHEKNEDYCIVCELMLHFDKRWVAVPGEPPVELGLTTSLSKELLEALRGELTSLEHVELGGI